MKWPRYCLAPLLVYFLDEAKRIQTAGFDTVNQSHPYDVISLR
jgi:hypothetical protein